MQIQSNVAYVAPPSAAQNGELPVPGSADLGAPQGLTRDPAQQVNPAGLAQSADHTDSDATGSRNADPKSVKDAVDKLNEAVKNYTGGSSLQFTVDPDTKAHVVKVIDMQSKEVIRQIPNKEALAMAQALDQFQGLFVKEKV